MLHDLALLVKLSTSHSSLAPTTKLKLNHLSLGFGICSVSL